MPQKDYSKIEQPDIALKSDFDKKNAKFDTPEGTASLENRVKALESLLGNMLLSGKMVLSKDIQMQDGRNIQLAKGTGTIIGTETNQKLGFFATTPVVQQTPQLSNGMTQNSGTAVLEGSTFAGNGGANEYTINDIVWALKVYGLLDT